MSDNDVFGLYKSSKVSFYLCLFLGLFGAHRFYLLKFGSGIFMSILTIISISLLPSVHGFILFVGPLYITIFDLFRIKKMTEEFNVIQKMYTKMH